MGEPDRWAYDFAAGDRRDAGPAREQGRGRRRDESLPGFAAATGHGRLIRDPHDHAFDPARAIRMLAEEV